MIQPLRQTVEGCQQKIESTGKKNWSPELLNGELIHLVNGCTFTMASPMVGEMIIRKNEDVNLHQLQLHNYSRTLFDRRVRKCRQKFSGKTEAIEKFNRLFKLKLSEIDQILRNCKSSMNKSLKEVSQFNALFY